MKATQKTGHDRISLFETKYYKLPYILATIRKTERSCKYYFKMCKLVK